MTTNPELPTTEAVCKTCGHDHQQTAGFHPLDPEAPERVYDFPYRLSNPCHCEAFKLVEEPEAETIQKVRLGLRGRPEPEPEADAVAAARLARLFHETYERLAPEFDYKTREASAVLWEDVPDNNKRLMTAVAAEVIAAAQQAPRVVELEADAITAALEAVAAKLHALAKEATAKYYDDRNANHSYLSGRDHALREARTLVVRALAPSPEENQGVTYDEEIAEERRRTLGRWWWLRPWNWSFARRRLRPGLAVVERQVHDAARRLEDNQGVTAKRDGGSDDH